MIDAGLFPAPQEAAFTLEEENILKARLFAMLSKQARLRTQGDHSSLREEDAAELLDSLVFTLRYSLFRQGKPMRALLTADLEEMLARGQDALQECAEEANALYQKALDGIKLFGSRSLRDTLRGIGQFFRCYDVRLYAHHVPASIDYQLCVPVAKELRGALYIREYLEKLLIENALVACFAPARVSALLRRVSPDYRDLLVNLYEPVAANAAGLSLLGEDIGLLKITHAQAAEIHRMLAVLPPAAARGRMADTARAVCDTLRLPGGRSRAYLARAAEALPPRICISSQSACGVFSAYL